MAAELFTDIPMSFSKVTPGRTGMHVQFPAYLAGKAGAANFLNAI